MIYEVQIRDSKQIKLLLILIKTYSNMITIISYDKSIPDANINKIKLLMLISDEMKKRGYEIILKNSYFASNCLEILKQMEGDNYDGDKQ